MNKPCAAIFDLDGTLIDSLADIADAVNRVLSRHGFPEHPREAYKLLIGEGAGNLVESALPPDGRHRSPELLLELREDYGRNLIVKTAPYTGVMAMLEELALRRVPLAVLSNKPHSMTQGITHALFAHVPFVAVAGHRSEFPRKPDPSAALHIAEQLKVGAADCFFVGDTKVDMQTAKAAGMRAVGVTWGFRSRAELEEHGADHIIDRPGDFAPLLPGGSFS